MMGLFFVVTCSSGLWRLYKIAFKNMVPIPWKYVLCFFLMGMVCSAQKVISREFTLNNIQSLAIVDDAIFKIEIVATSNPTIDAVLHVWGEHSENVQLEAKTSHGTLNLATGLTPFFTPEDDKLAAHKLMAIELQLSVPSQIALFIKSSLASTAIDGHHQNIEVALRNGSCRLTNFKGNAHIGTIGGNITVSAQKGEAGRASSIVGKVENLLPNRGKNQVVAESYSGDISLLQTK